MTDTKLHDVIRDTLWHLYGYWVAYEDARPATHRRVNEDAEAIIEAIEQAGYVVVERNRWEIGREAWQFMRDALRTDGSGQWYLSGPAGTVLRSEQELEALLWRFVPTDVLPIGGED